MDLRHEGHRIRFGEVEFQFVFVVIFDMAWAGLIVSSFTSAAGTRLDVLISARRSPIRTFLFL